MTDRQLKSPKRYAYALCEAVGIPVPKSIYRSSFDRYLINLDFKEISEGINMLNRFIDASKAAKIEMAKVNLSEENDLFHDRCCTPSYPCRLSISVYAYPEVKISRP